MRKFIQWVKQWIKKVAFGGLVALCVVWFLWTVFVSTPTETHAIQTAWPYGTIDKQDEATTDIGKILQEDSSDPNGVSEKVQVAYKVNFTDKQRGTAYLASIINWFLAISGLVALIILIVGFYKMFLAKDNEEALKDARKTVTSAVIALLVIGSAWFIVSQFFDVYFRVKNDTSP